MENVESMDIEDLEKLVKQKKKQRRRRVKRRWRFSEKIILFILIYSVIVFERSLYFAFKTGAESVWPYLIPVIGTLASSAFAVFIWKEKNENIPKIMANPNYDDELAEEYRNLGR